MCCNFSIILLIVIGVMGYKYIIRGNLEQVDDHRLAILVTANERDQILSEMRVFLQSAQQISSGIAEGDMALVASAARKAAQNTQSITPGALDDKLPDGFTTMGLDTRARFEALAVESEGQDDQGRALSGLSVLLENCVSCHTAFRLAVDGAASI